MPASICHNGRTDLGIYERVLALSNREYPAFLEALLNTLPHRPLCIIHGERSHGVFNSAPFSGVRNLVNIVNGSWLSHPLRQRIRWLSEQESDNILRHLFQLFSWLSGSDYQDPLLVETRRELLWAKDSVGRPDFSGLSETIINRFGDELGELCVNGVQGSFLFRNGIPDSITNYLRNPANGSQLPGIQFSINHALRSDESNHILFGIWSCDDEQCNHRLFGLYNGKCSCGNERSNCIPTDVGDVFIAIVAVCDTRNCGGYARFGSRCKKCGQRCRTIHVPNDWRAAGVNLHYYYVHKFVDGKFEKSLDGSNEIINDVYRACTSQRQRVPQFLRHRYGGLKSITPRPSRGDTDLASSSFGVNLLKRFKNNNRMDGELQIGTTQYVSVGPYNSTREMINIATY